MRALHQLLASLYPRRVPDTNSPHSALLDLPPTLENINAKLNHLIAVHASDQRFNANLLDEVTKCVEKASGAEKAAQRIANDAVEILRARQPLTTRQRMGAIMAGGALGGGVGFVVALLTLLLWHY